MSPRPSVPRPSARAARPLVVSPSGRLLDDLLRLSAAAGVEVDVAPDVAAAREVWLGAPLVLVDDTALRQAVTTALPKRRDVVVVGGDVDDATLWQRAMRVGADHVVVLPDGEVWLVDRLAEVRDGDGAPARVVAVVGGRGGAGSSTLAAALATNAVGRGLRSMLVDLDPLGGGIDLALGLEGASGLRWPDLAAARGRLNGGSLRDALPAAGELPVLSWDRGSDIEVPFDAARSVLDAAVRVSDVVVVDLPRTGGAAAHHVAGRATDLLVVVPAEVRAVAAAERVLRTYRPLAPGLRAVVRAPGPTGLDAAAVCAALDLPLAGELRPEPNLAQSLDRGEAPGRRARGPLARLCAALLEPAG